MTPSLKLPNVLSYQTIFHGATSISDGVFNDTSSCLDGRGSAEAHTGLFSAAYRKKKSGKEKETNLVESEGGEIEEPRKKMTVRKNTIFGFTYVVHSSRGFWRSDGSVISSLPEK